MSSKGITLRVNVPGKGAAVSNIIGLLNAASVHAC